MKRILSFVGLALLCILTLSCTKENPISKPENWTVFTVGYNAELDVYFDDDHNFCFHLGQNYRGYTLANYNKGYGGAGICLVNNVAALGKIEDYDALSYQTEVVLFSGACAVEKNTYNGYTAYTAFTIEDWETSSMLGHYQLIQVKYPDGKIYPEPIEE